MIKRFPLYFLYFFFGFFAYILFAEPFDYVLQKNSIFRQELNDDQITYYVNTTYYNNSLKNICVIEQPHYRLFYYSHIFDQTDPKIFLNQHYMLGVDNFFYILLKSGNLQVFNVSLQESKASLYHLNEITLWNKDFINEINQREAYVGMFYVQKAKSLIILTKKIIVLVNVEHKNKTEWFKYSFYPFNNDTTHILYAKILDDSLFVLRKNNMLEKWKIINNTHFNLVEKINFKDKFNDFRGKDINITDFEVNEDYFCFLEKNLMQFYVVKLENFFDNPQGNIVKTISFPSLPVLIELIQKKIFILSKSDSSNSLRLSEYEINNDFSLIKTWEIDDNYIDLFVGEDYFIHSYPNYLKINPHSFEAPEEVNANLVRRYNVTNIQYIEPFVLTEENEMIPFKALKNDGFSLLKIISVGPVLNCDLNDVEMEEFSFKLDLYQLPCKNMDFNCDKSIFSVKSKTFNIKVVGSDGLSGYFDKSKNSSSIHLGILIICLVVALFIIICCGVYLMKVIRVSKETQNLLKIEAMKYTQRVMSREELEMIQKKEEGKNHE